MFASGIRCNQRRENMVAAGWLARLAVIEFLLCETNWKIFFEMEFSTRNLIIICIAQTMTCGGGELAQRFH